MGKKGADISSVEVEFDNLGYNDSIPPTTNTQPRVVEENKPNGLCTRSPRCCCIWISFILVFLIYAGVVIALCVIFLVYGGIPGLLGKKLPGAGPSPTTTASPPKIVYPSFSGSFVIDQPWDNELSNQNSPYYKLFVDCIRNQITIALAGFPDPAVTNADVKIIGLSEGSVSVQFLLQAKAFLKDNASDADEKIKAQIKSNWKQGMKMKDGSLTIKAKVACANIPECAGGTCVDTQQGCVKGKVRTLDVGQGQVKVKQYFGVPFAAPPVGKLRFADPQPAKAWDGVLDATNYGPACVLPLDTTYPKTFWPAEMWNPQGNRSEDCLQLNVYAPEGAKSASVMVWIFGGGFYSGSATLEGYDGAVLAASQGVVVVSINYRVGMLGFLSTGDGRIKGNFGLKDQLLALQWVRDNIANMGGNPDSVTLFGESSGGASIGFFMMSPLSKGLFKRAIINSAAPGARWAYMTPSQAMRRSDAIFQSFKCTQKDTEKLLECLRALKADYIGGQWNDYITSNLIMFPWAPTIDGKLITEDPFEKTRKGFQSDVDLMIGFNKNEGSYWNLYAYAELTKDKAYCPLNASAFEAAARSALSTFPKQVQDDVIKMYSKGITDGNSRTNALDRLTGEFLSFSCPAVLFANAHSGKGNKVYKYKLDYRASNQVWPAWMGVIHGADIQWFFGQPLNQEYIDRHEKKHNLVDYTKAEKTLAKKILNYVGSFAKTGTPSSKDAPVWPQYDTTSYQGIKFTPSGTIEKVTVKEGTDCTALWRYQKTDNCCKLTIGFRHSKFTGSLTITDPLFPWKTELQDTKSTYYRTYSRAVKEQLEETLEAHSDPGIRTAEIKILSFGSGSGGVVANFELTTKHYLKAADADVAKALGPFIANYWSGYMKIDKQKITVSPKT